MKLKGSLTEQKYKEQLTKSRHHLFNDSSHRPLLNLLKDHYPNFRTAYILDWIPEQGEDIYIVLINNDRIAIIEMQRLDLNVETILESKSIEEYQKGLSKTKRILLAVAQELSEGDMNISD